MALKIKLRSTTSILVHEFRTAFGHIIKTPYSLNHTTSILAFLPQAKNPIVSESRVVEVTPPSHHPLCLRSLHPGAHDRTVCTRGCSFRHQPRGIRERFAAQMPAWTGTCRCKKYQFHKRSVDCSMSIDFPRLGPGGRSTPTSPRKKAAGKAVCSKCKADIVPLLN